MRNINPVIQLARERALFRFTALAHPMVQDASDSIGKALSGAHWTDERASNGALQFLRHESAFFLKRFESIFRALLDRAMATMYDDARLSLDAFSGSELSLIDDETVNRQMEVDHLLQRMREADDADISRLNIMIAQLHDHGDVKERENPFRPYLIARSLHEVLIEMVPDDAISAVLFSHLSTALANHLAEYYSAICDVFEANGVQAQLLVRPSRDTRFQKYAEGASLELEPNALSNPRVLSGLQRMLVMMHNLPSGTAAQIAQAAQNSLGVGPQTGQTSSSADPYAASGIDAQTPQAPSNTDPQATQTPSAAAGQPAELQNFVRNLFKQTGQFGTQGSLNFDDVDASDGVASIATAQDQKVLASSMELIAKLSQFQKTAAGELASNGRFMQHENMQHENQLFSVGEQIEASKTTAMERTTIDVVAILFEFILEDEQIPAGVRGQIGRLQIPFLKAAMLAPDLLHRTDHPARVLLNRLGSAAVGLDPDSPIGHAVLEEMTRIVKKILTEFDDDIALFSRCLAELEQFLVENLRHADTGLALSVDAIEAAEQGNTQPHDANDTLQELLSPLNLDKRVFDFITQTWVRVMKKEAEEKNLNRQARFQQLLPELVWSVQEKRNPDERSALMRLLPGLVKWLKTGLVLIQMPELESKQALDQFVAMHMDVLRAGQPDNGEKLPTLEELRQLFSQLRFTPEGEQQTSTSVVPSQMQEEVIKAALADRGASASLDMGGDVMPALETDTDWLSQMKLGICVERWTQGTFQPARLNWISKKMTLYLFMLENNPTPVVYSARSLTKGLREGSVRLVESAPAFDRAVQSLLIDVEAIQSHSSSTK